jgi:hypothetical protein
MNLPPMHDVTSSNIHSVGDDGKDLFVRFKPSAKKPEGDVYQLSGAAHHAQPMRTAASPGGYYHAHLRNAYPAVKL